MSRGTRASLRAELVRVGLRLLLKRRSRGQTLAQARRSFRRMDALIPSPPRSTRVTRIDAGGIPADRIVTPQTRRGRHLIYLHGGGYRLGSATTYRHFTWRVAAAARCTVLAVEYRLAPEHRFPAALDDAMTAYRWHLAQGGAPQELIVMGDSAGGGLTLALLLRLRDEGVALPAAAIVLSPWTDLALTGDSLVGNAETDPMLNAEDLPPFAADYLGEADPRDPYASPLYGDLTGLPPVLIQVGGDEILHDDAVRMADRLTAAGVAVDLRVWPRMPHVWPVFAPILPEANEALAVVGEFARGMLDRV